MGRQGRHLVADELGDFGCGGKFIQRGLTVGHGRFLSPTRRPGEISCAPSLDAPSASLPNVRSTTSGGWNRHMALDCVGSSER